MPQEPLPESQHVDILVDLLSRFPEIYTITLNLPSSSCRLSYMVRRTLSQKEYGALRRHIRESLETFFYLHRHEQDRPLKLRRERYHDLTQLQFILNYDFLLGKTAGLLTAIISDLFQLDLITENRAAANSWRPDSELIKELTPAPESLFHRRSNRLVAFRDSGKVYIFDK